LTTEALKIHAEIEVFTKSRSLREASERQRIIHQRLKQLDEKIEEAKVEFKANGRDLDLLKNIITISQDLRSVLRKAVSTCRNSLEKQAQNIRQDLLGSDDALKQRNRELAMETEMQNSQSFTEALKRTRGLLAREISRSSTAHDVLVSSTKVVDSTKAEYNVFGEALARGRSLAGRLIRRERTDRILVLTALLFYVLTIIYVVRRRLPTWVPSFYLLIPWLISFVYQPSDGSETLKNITNSTSNVSL